MKKWMVVGPKLGQHRFRSEQRLRRLQCALAARAGIKIPRPDLTLPWAAAAALDEITIRKLRQYCNVRSPAQILKEAQDADKAA